jgi:four helix bundle protein
MIPGAQELQRRTRKFFLRVLRVCERLPQNPATNRIAGQLKDAAEGADARYRTACRAASLEEFIRNVALASHDMEHAKNWLRTLHSVGFGNQAEKRDLMHEAVLLLRAYDDAQKTARGLLPKASGLRARNERL